MNLSPINFEDEDRGDSDDGLMSDGEFWIQFSRTSPALAKLKGKPPHTLLLSGGFEFSVTGALVKRKDILDLDPSAKSQSHRTYFYKKDVDLNNVVETCTNSLRKNRPLSVMSMSSNHGLPLSPTTEMDILTR